MGKKPAKCFKENAFILFERNSGRRAGGSQLSAPRATRFGNWSRTNYRVHYVRSLGGSDPVHYIWAALSPKMEGRSRPNRGFRLRSFFRPTVAQAGLRSGLTSARYRTQTAHFVQNTANVSVFCV